MTVFDRIKIIRFCPITENMQKLLGFFFRNIRRKCGCERYPVFRSTHAIYRQCEEQNNLLTYFPFQHCAIMYAHPVSEDTASPSEREEKTKQNWQRHRKPLANPGRRRGRRPKVFTARCYAQRDILPCPCQIVHVSVCDGGIVVIYSLYQFENVCTYS